MGVWPLCNTYPLAVPSMPCLLFERGKEEREKVGHQKVVCADGLASIEALSSWKTLCILSWTTLELEDALHTWAPEADSTISLWAPEAEPSPAGQFFMLDGFHKMREEEQDSSSLSCRWKKKKMPSFSEISYCLVPYKKDFCTKLPSQGLIYIKYVQGFLFLVCSSYSMCLQSVYS